MDYTFKGFDNRAEVEKICSKIIEIIKTYGVCYFDDVMDLIFDDVMDLTDGKLAFDMHNYGFSDPSKMKTIPGEDGQYYLVIEGFEPMSEIKIKYPVNHPDHYISESGIEAIDVIKAFTSELEGYEAVATSQVLKYILRWKNKNGLEDLKKAKWYLEDLIKYVEEENN